ncbi:DNA (cytosine-5)-methyltransferase 1 [Variovorax boronicumulans]|uniref:DNA cytosine methyltransferase n=1 Tax=Variovorax boronicumulans TaxID=436515 RepID=UPI00277F712B|nr:DNA cytosine methyltransferase [Variovorax boronicumulans]MDQ0068319.1 DNA (cytosine-5)-methyltransferase 1 [Variovorax boronicumulans]
MAEPAYYNEHEPYAAAWLRNLIDAGHIAPGIVDERSIEDVFPSDLRGFTQCHFFAGIGVWSHALRSAGWSDDRPVWSGSCPCQPFSTSGKGVGFDDERHLWPAWHHLIKECAPAVVLGEQVASPDGLNWLDLVHTDMEAARHAFAAFDLSAAGVGAPHGRQRIFFVAMANASSDRGWSGPRIPTRPRRENHADGNGLGGRSFVPWLCTDGKRRPIEPGLEPVVNGSAEMLGQYRAYGNTINARVAQTFIEAVMEAA